LEILGVARPSDVVVPLHVLGRAVCVLEGECDALMEFFIIVIEEESDIHVVVSASDEQDCEKQEQETGSKPAWGGLAYCVG
jgi:hypothetical protein